MISIENDQPFHRLRLQHGKVNAMDLEFCQAIRLALKNMAEAPECRGVVVTGQPNVFSAGIDLKRWLAEPPEYVGPFMSELEGLFQDAFAFPKPIVAAIEGPAVAGGCMLAAACDFRVLSPTASIGIPEMRIGVALPMAAIEIMRFVCSNQAFQSVVNLGKMYTGNDAVEVGIVSHVASDPVEAAMHLATQLTGIPTPAFSMTKRQSRLHAIGNIKQLQDSLGEEYFQIWNSDETRSAIQHYVSTRL